MLSCKDNYVTDEYVNQWEGQRKTDRYRSSYVAMWTIETGLTINGQSTFPLDLLGMPSRRLQCHGALHLMHQ